MERCPDIELLPDGRAWISPEDPVFAGCLSVAPLELQLQVLGLEANGLAMMHFAFCDGPAQPSPVLFGSTMLVSPPKAGLWIFTQKRLGKLRRGGMDVAGGVTV
ncbi:hypothetical protein MKX08_002332 [Trichoderma sp. CBMAI-0020]|nr:hypothetical protein MKX08_002332 [Trichoderma sp. CBMAI-0020]